jgi:RimJ/RimL family protein N-acetyltransferase
MPIPTLLDTDAPDVRDGSGVRVRPLVAEDRAALGAAFERFGERSRYQRFHAAMPRLSDAQLQYLSDVDQRDHVAIAAIDREDRIVGVARCIRLQGSDAELALGVVDDHQGRGVGGVLLTALIDRGREQGMTRLRALVLAENVPMLRLLRRIGDARFAPAGAALDVTVDIAPDLPEATTRLRMRASRGRGHSSTAGLVERPPQWSAS